MPTGATAHRSRAVRAALRDRRVLGCILLGASVGAAGFAALAIARAVPPGTAPRAGAVWGLIAAALLAIGAALWLLPNARVPRRHAFLAAGAGLAFTLLATVAIHPDQWRSIAGHPDNAPSSFYRSASVTRLLDRLVRYADGRPILGIYLSNHYESSIIVPLQNGPSGSTGGEIISVLANGDKQVVQTKLSPGIANADGLDPDAVKPRVITAIVTGVIDGQALSDRDEVRVQVQRRNGATTYEVMTRKDGVDQPWERFDLDGKPL